MNPTRKRLISGLTIVLIILVFSLSCTFWNRNNKQILTLNGTIEVDDILVGSKIGGRITEVLVKEGDNVKREDILLQLDNAELSSKREQSLSAIQQAKETIQQRSAYLSLLQSGSRKQEIDKAKADLDSIKSKLDLAMKDAQRYESLYKDGAVSQQQRDNAVNQVDVLKSQVKSAQEIYNLVKSGFRKEEITQAKANLDSAQANLQQLQHVLNEVDTQLKEMSITAPQDAVVEVCNLRKGDLLSPNEDAITLVIPDKLWVRVYAPENYLGLLKENSQVNIKTDSYAKETFHGVVEQINRKAEFTPRNVQTVEERINTVFGVKIRLDNSSGKLRAGMSTDVTFPDIKLMK